MALINYKKISAAPYEQIEYIKDAFKSLCKSFVFFVIKYNLISNKIIMKKVIRMKTSNAYFYTFIIFCIFCETLLGQNKVRKKLSEKEFARMEIEKKCKLPEKENIIIWDEKYKLDIDDFWEKQKNPELKYEVHGYIGIVVGVETSILWGKVVFRIYAAMDKSKSWIDKKKSEEYIQYVLNHEQRHFDLAEIIARKLRKKIMRKFWFRISLSWKDLRHIDDLYDEYRKIQNQYDSEIEKEGRSAQERWDKWIDEELERTKEWYNKHLVIVKRCRCK